MAGWARPAVPFFSLPVPGVRLLLRLRRADYFKLPISDRFASRQGLALLHSRSTLSDQPRAPFGTHFAPLRSTSTPYREREWSGAELSGASGNDCCSTFAPLAQRKWSSVSVLLVPCAGDDKLPVATGFILADFEC